MHLQVYYRYAIKIMTKNYDINVNQYNLFNNMNDGI